MNKTGIRLEGVDEVLNNLNRELSGTRSRSLAGLFEAGLMLQRVSQQELQKSVISGNLRASAYTRRSGDFVRLDPDRLDSDQVSKDPQGMLPETTVELGFTALYAAHVHENMESRSPKYLEGPLDRNRDKIIKIVQKRGML